MEVLNMFKSKWCWLSTIIGLVLGIWLSQNFVVWTELDIIKSISILAFLVLFPISLSCNIRLLVQRWKEAKALGGSLFHMILYTMGFVALQSCFVGGFCGVSLGTSLIFLLPSGLASAFLKNSPLILIAVDVLLLAGLWYMKCFEKEDSGKIQLKMG